MESDAGRQGGSLTLAPPNLACSLALFPSPPTFTYFPLPSGGAFVTLKNRELNWQNDPIFLSDFFFHDSASPALYKTVERAVSIRSAWVEGKLHAAVHRLDPTR